jgi:uncharacterized protein YecE (DUF72 family)
VFVSLAIVHPRAIRGAGVTLAGPPAVAARKATVRVGISGYIYPNWRGVFYPRGLPARRELEYASRQYNSIELNGTFYSLKWPAVYERWYSETPKGFVFAIKGSRFITHNLKLRNAEAALGNFLASGVFALAEKTGPFLWQLPGTYRFDAERINSFLSFLPRTTTDAEAIARGHDHRLKRGALIDAPRRMRFRHALEVRHPSYFNDELYDVLRQQKVAFVVADTAGKFPYAEEVTADFVYVRLHGSRTLYVSGYTPRELDKWADRTRRWLRRGHDTYVYFDNDAKVYAPRDAKNLSARLAKRLAPTSDRAAKRGEGAKD